MISPYSVASPSLTGASSDVGRKAACLSFATLWDGRPISSANSSSDGSLPSTSVSQYAATLAQWFGVSGGELGQVLPYIANFNSVDYPTNLGFMA